ncbi:unnamed protein product [Rotaria magnacalcarata]|uniref:Uncharacterized protein n=2 Tax=Rotaria magnacalcarata TaxID=392030 RepID=A0A816N6A0_9BILA|nr:unnamed protein product [Rotaria magnacalcarata]CAF2027681.1 unnamed protein product [Rotaria magnacalcarata]CAF2083922.1 unnamed protein product [Rotaria magnacalcarata]CAF2115786.1 unnamed protein product [Rotaria magnacalcarata]CAF3866745.1 unnamed protein product [Rotaria magnacalcarata]
MVCALIASTGWAQQADWVSQICQGYTTNQYIAALVECSQNSSPDSYQSLLANTVKTATIVIFILSLVTVIIIFLIHVFVALRKRKHWKMTTRIVAVILIPFFLLVFAISIAAIFWEVKLVTIFGSRYTSNSYQSTPNGYRKAQTGAAGAAASFGLLAAVFLLIDIICRLLTIGSLRKRNKRRAMRVDVIS